MKILLKKIKKLTNLVSSQDTVVPFTEQPSVEPKDTTMLSADDLFSLFTANIIKEKIKFTR